jgi:hypothetical protein
MGFEEDQTYNTLRKKSLLLFTDRLFDLSDDCFVLYDNGFSNYEDHLFRHLDTAEMSAYEDVILEITTEILSYKAAIQALNLQISAYDDLSVSTGSLDPTLQGYVFTKSIELANLTDEYLTFLLTSRDFILEILNETSSLKASAFSDYADRIFEDSISENYLQMMLTYMDVAEIHSYIASADYFAGLDLALRISPIIDGLDASEDAQAIRDLYNNAALSGAAPADLIQPTSITEVSETSFMEILTSFFITNVYADDNDRMKNAMTLLHILGNVELETRSSDSESKDLITAAIMNVISNYSKDRKAPVQSPGNIKKTAEAKPDLKSEILEALEKEKLPVKNQSLSLEEEKIAQEKKLEIIQKLKDGQKKLSLLGLSRDIEIAFGGDGSKTINTQYTQIIAAAVALLEKKGSNIDSEKFEKINGLLNKNLEILLGDKKEAFVNKFIETSAEDLVQKFTDWKNNALSLNNLDFDKNTLLSLLSSMGIDIRVPEKTVSNSASEESDEPPENVQITDIDEVLPESLTILGLDSLGFEQYANKRENNGLQDFHLIIGYSRPREYSELTNRANLNSTVSAKINYYLPGPRSRPESSSISSTNSYIDSNTIKVLVEDEIGKNYRLTAFLSRKRVGNSDTIYEMRDGYLNVESGPLAIEMRFNDIPIDEYPKIRAIMIAFASEMLAKAGGDISQFETTAPAPVVDSESTLSGKVILNERSEANNMRVEINYYDKGGIFVDSTTVVTDSNGNFSSAFPYPVNAGYAAVLTIPLVYYNDDNKPIAYITDKEKNISQPIVLFAGEYIVNSNSDLTIQCDLYDGTAFEKESTATEESTSSQAYVYFYQSMKEGIEYYQNTLDYEFTSRLPIRFVLNEEVGSAKDAMGYYDFELDAIHIMKEQSTLDSEYMPNLLYHELSHYIMTMLYYPDYPGTRGIDTDTYHGGYSNSYTGYSYSEGFAFFMESMIGLHYYGEPSHVLGDLEVNHKAWENSGYSETLAVGSILFDLVDTGGSNDESVTIPLKDLWKILDHNQRHFADVYDELKSTYPNLSTEIDQIFIDHGFYVVTDVYEAGAGVYNFGEAFVDLNENNACDAGETFIDYNAVDANGTYIQEYRDGYTIGYAGYANDIERK